MTTENLMTTKEAAEKLGLTTHTLDCWRCKKNMELPFVKIGRSVRYDPMDVQRFIEKRKVAIKEAC